MITYLATLGILLSLYVYYVELRSKDKNYDPICDFSEKVSCTKAFKSKYGKILGFSNSLAGIIYYVIVLLSWFYYPEALIIITTGGIIISIILAYIMYAKVKSLCVICTSTYIVNIALFIVALIM